MAGLGAPSSAPCVLIVQYGGFAVEGVVNLKARNFAAQLVADGVAFEQGTYATAGYDPVRL